MTTDTNILKALEAVLDKHGDVIVKTIKSALHNEGKVASGKLEESVKFKVSIYPYKISLEILAEDYLRWVDQGRKPGKRPPLKSILKWIKLKGIVPTGLPKSIKGISRKRETLAYLISRSIGIKGIKPSNVVSESIKSHDQELEISIGKAINTGLTQDIAESMKDENNKFIRIKTQVK